MTATLPSQDVAAEALAQALRAAGAAEFRLAYQPQVCLTSGRIVGVEALLRWCSPRLGEVSPSEFIPVAERAGLIAELGHRVLHSACADAAAWRRAGLPAIRVAVNVSPLQFRSRDIVADVREALARFGLPAPQLAIEITESALMHDSGEVAAALHRLRDDGVEIALDDFGTGYSSLARLRVLPIDLVKVDRSFVHDVTTAASAASVTRSVISLAHGLHLRVLAEGVETEEQLRLLVAHGCDFVQGWVFSAAIPSDALVEMLRSGRTLPRELTHRRERERTLLLVDDEEHILSALKRVFRRAGYKLLTAASGTEALRMLAAHPVDVIVSDQRMPGMTGVEFLRQAKELYPDTVRMTLSGYTDLQSIIDAVNEGAVYKFLTKPWDDARLREHVEQAFRFRNLAEENHRLAHRIAAANTELAESNRRLERLVAKEHERVRATLAAAGGARDLVDLMPLAVFGFDRDGTLAFANRLACETFPEWAADLGGEPAAALGSLLREVAVASPEGLSIRVGACQFGARYRRLGGGESPWGSVLMLQAAARVPVPECEEELG